MVTVTGSISGEEESSREVESMPSGFEPEEEDGVKALKVYTVQDKIQMIRRFEAEGAPIRDFCSRVGVSTASFCRWLKAYKAQGEAGLEPAENPRNTGHTHHGPHSPDARRQAVEAFQKSGIGFEDFARLWGIAPSSLRKWVERYERLGPKGLESMYSKKKGHRRLSQGVRQKIRKVSEENPGFGLKKVRDYLFRFGGLKTSTGSISKTLKEEGIARPKKKKGRRKYKPRKKVRRFERSRAGEMWQSDITTFLLARQSQRVYLTVFLDDHSRYIVSFALALQQRQELVIEALLDGIQKFGKPREVLTDQGRQYFAWRGKTQFQGVLKREGIQHVVSRAHHPETLGKTERFWDTVETEFWERAHPEELGEARKRLDHFIAHYNHFRPHQGIDGMVPADRFFGAENEVRKAIEETMEKNELYQAIGEAPRQTAYLVGQIGDQKVSLFGEKGRLVIQTSDGKRKEIGYDELGMDQAPAQEGGRDGTSEGAGSEAGSKEDTRDSKPVEPGDQGAQESGLAGEGVVGSSERGGKAQSAQAGGGDSGELAGPDEPEGSRPKVGDTPSAVVAVEPAGLERDDGGASGTAQGEGEGSDIQPDETRRRSEEAEEKGSRVGGEAPDGRGADRDHEGAASLEGAGEAGERSQEEGAAEGKKKEEGDGQPGDSDNESEPGSTSGEGRPETRGLGWLRFWE